MKRLEVGRPASLEGEANDEPCFPAGRDLQVNEIVDDGTKGLEVLVDGPLGGSGGPGRGDEVGQDGGRV